MLHQFPLDAPYHEVPDLERLGGSEPSSEDEAIERLSRLLPDLGDEVIPVVGGRDGCQGIAVGGKASSTSSPATPILRGVGAPPGAMA